MKEAYVSQRFNKKSAHLITLCNDIVNSYIKKGLVMTIRQLYYQLVARGHIPNTVQSYENIQGLMNNARLAGLIDWEGIEDRMRNFITRTHFKNGKHLLDSAANWYHEDLWSEQENRVFVVVEKDALAGVLEGTCYQYDCPLLPARGYPSASALREFAKNRIMGACRNITILHLGDHDPSGIDMSRDLIDRLHMFTRDTVDFTFRRIALNINQIEQWKPPPNPAKVTDSRYEGYVAAYGEESWELDALSPEALSSTLENEIKPLIDQEAWDIVQQRIDRVKARIQKLADEYKDEEE